MKKSRTQKETERRQRILTLVDQLTSAGHTKERAAKLAKVNPSTLWRWRKRLIPNFENSGRPAVIDSFQVSESLIGKVQRLQLAGLSNSGAWRQIAEDPSCPLDLAAFLRATVTLPPSFLNASRLVSSAAKIISGRNFTHIVQSNKSTT